MNGSSDTYSADVVVMVRHPCSVVASYLSLDWESELDAILMHPVPEGFPGLREEIARRNAAPKDRIADLILQWKLFTAKTLELQRHRPTWTFVLHDDLCRRPMHYFEAIFETLELPLTPVIAEKIRRETSRRKVERAPGTCSISSKGTARP